MARPRQFTDDEILSAARVCFLEHGASVSTSHIAGEIGLSQAALFKRFQTKENLLIKALAPPEEPSWIARAQRGPTDAPIDEQLVAIGVDALVFLRELMPRIMVLKSAGIDPTDIMSTYETPPPVRAIQHLAGFLEQARHRGRLQTDDVATLAMQFMGTIHVRAYFGHMFHHASSPEQDVAYVRAAVRNLWKGLAPTESR